MVSLVHWCYTTARTRVWTMTMRTLWRASVPKFVEEAGDTDEDEEDNDDGGGGDEYGEDEIVLDSLLELDTDDNDDERDMVEVLNVVSPGSVKFPLSVQVVLLLAVLLSEQELDDSGSLLDVGGVIMNVEVMVVLAWVIVVSLHVVVAGLDQDSVSEQLVDRGGIYDSVHVVELKKPDEKESVDNGLEERPDWPRVTVAVLVSPPPPPGLGRSLNVVVEGDSDADAAVEDDVPEIPVLVGAPVGWFVTETETDTEGVLDVVEASETDLDRVGNVELVIEGEPESSEPDDGLPLPVTMAPPDEVIARETVEIKLTPEELAVPLDPVSVTVILLEVAFEGRSVSVSVTTNVVPLSVPVIPLPWLSVREKDVWFEIVPPISLPSPVVLAVLMFAEGDKVGEAAPTGLADMGPVGEAAVLVVLRDRPEPERDVDTAPVANEEAVPKVVALVAENGGSRLGRRKLDSDTPARLLDVTEAVGPSLSSETMEIELVTVPEMMVHVAVPTIAEDWPLGPPENVEFETGKGGAEDVELPAAEVDIRPEIVDVVLPVKPPDREADGIRDPRLSVCKLSDDESVLVCEEVDCPPGTGTPEIQGVLVKFQAPELIAVGLPGKESSDVELDIATEMSVTTITVQVDASPVATIVLVTFPLCKEIEGATLVCSNEEAVTLVGNAGRLVTTVDVHKSPVPVPTRVLVMFTVADPVPEPTKVLVTFWLDHENGGEILGKTVGNDGRAKESEADEAEPLLTRLVVQELPVLVPVRVTIVALGLGQENGGNTLVKSGSVGVTDVLLAVAVADPVWFQVDVQAPPVPPPVPGSFVVVFWTGQEKGGNTLVMTVTSGGLVKVTVDGPDPWSTSVDVHVPPPVPVPMIVAVVFCGDGHENGGKTLVKTYVDVQDPPVPVPVMMVVTLGRGHEKGGKILVKTVGSDPPVRVAFGVIDPLTTKVDVHTPSVADSVESTVALWVCHENVPLTGCNESVLLPNDEEEMVEVWVPLVLAALVIPEKGAVAVPDGPVIVLRGVVVFPKNCVPDATVPLLTPPTEPAEGVKNSVPDCELVTSGRPVALPLKSDEMTLERTVSEEIVLDVRGVGNNEVGFGKLLLGELVGPVTTLVGD
ncbi:hypothetical protein Micbo1qcDRAFT_176337 [Microdochium bolleyi]|uniref:Uncharacterized protein n=1 Tax=Microdochium bolleyi TaxID=196109 RepID=A0A136J0J4_9PEZI|nr:hypothetical protein Micbo1qcDRAFT_176337 [Microdochium bolleyi]